MASNLMENTKTDNALMLVQASPKEHPSGFRHIMNPSALCRLKSTVKGGLLVSSTVQVWCVV